MGVCYRQSKRIWRRYQDAGDAGLVHRLRGQPSARRKAARTAGAGAGPLCRGNATPTFGPTLMAEQLLKRKLVVDHETFAALAAGGGPAHGAAPQQVHRQWRERKPSFGAMVQLDGSQPRLVLKAAVRSVC